MCTDLAGPHGHDNLEERLKIRLGREVRKSLNAPNASEKTEPEKSVRSTWWH